MGSMTRQRRNRRTTRSCASARLVGWPAPPRSCPCRPGRHRGTPAGQANAGSRSGSLWRGRRRQTRGQHARATAAPPPPADFARRAPVLGGVAADLRLDGIELADASPLAAHSGLLGGLSIVYGDFAQLANSRAHTR